jgi:glycosyltransferase involved in cell wall biosynthesis
MAAIVVNYLLGRTSREDCRAKVCPRCGALTVANFVGAALNFVQGILVARWLGPELYGVAALVMTYPNFVYGLFDARSVGASVEILGRYHALGQRNEMVVTVLRAVLIVGLVLAGWQVANVKLAQFMACGVPVVSTDLDESFIVRETGCGIVCKSQEDFAQALVGLAQSAEKRAELGNAGRIYAKTHLDWSVLMPIYKDILNE